MSDTRNPKTSTQRVQTHNRILDEVLESVLEAVVIARDLLHHDDPNVKLKAIHAVSQSSLSAQRLYESTELLRRLEDVEEYRTTERTLYTRNRSIQ